ncbi:ATP-binding protein [soil metagenome]
MTDGLYIGGRTGTDPIEPVTFDSADLTTHGVIVGMTGSGKTGFAITLLEEVLLAGIPVLAIDPKGDLGNLALRFPDLSAEQFAPWVGDADIADAGGDRTAAATAVAQRWRDGLAGWDITPERIAESVQSADVSIYTPGSTSGVPLNVVGSLAAPTGDAAGDTEAIRQEISGYVTSLLSLAGEHADPVQSPAHTLLSTLIERSWAHQRDLDLAQLIGQVLDPPLRKLGVFDLNTFYPADDRRALAMRLNTLIASPSFAAWLQGPPLAIRDLLHTADGRPRASVLSIAHLSEEQRRAVVSLVLGRLITWMRAQPGTGALRALVYIDEVFGLAPPTAAPPSKQPILTLLKQARAYGVGTVLATQNPVDLDYKAMSNAATWVVGRLQTERDKSRIVEGLRSVRGDVDVDDLDRKISGLDKRQFILQSAHLPAPVELTSRWAMSYLAGPLTSEQLRTLTADDPARAATSAAAAEPAPAPAPAATSAPADATVVMPPVADGTPVRWLDPAAPWGDQVGVAPDGPVCEAAVVARVALHYDERAADVDHRDEWEAMWFPVGEQLDPAAAIAVDYDDRDLRSDRPDGVGYRIPDAPIDTKTFFRSVAADLKDHLRRDQQITILHNPELKLYSRVDESRDTFVARCDTVAQERADTETAKVTDKLRSKERQLSDKLTRARQRVEQLEVDESSRKRGELLAGAGQLLSVVFGGRRSTRSVVTGLGRAVSGMASRRGTISRTAQRREAAEEQATQVTDDLAALEERLADELTGIDERWRAVAAAVEERTVGLERDDIDVTDVALAWVRRDA